MAITMYDLIIPSFLQGFGVLSKYLDKAAAFANEKGLKPADLIEARLAPDMFTFAGQIQRASDKAKAGIGRLTDIEIPTFADTETTFDELKARVAKTVAFVQGVNPKKLDGSETRTVDFKTRTFNATVPGEVYLMSILLPDFWFHVTTAHDILRNRGVQIGKVDYLGRNN
ncbi:MAG: DUF1993 family protein [Myxococcaceae bacterium]